MTFHSWQGCFFQPKASSETQGRLVGAKEVALIKFPKKDMKNITSSTVITVPLKATNSTKQTLGGALSNSAKKLGSSNLTTFFTGVLRPIGRWRREGDTLTSLP